MARFSPGCTPGPGRPPGSWSGRRRALAIIDEMLSEEGNAEALRAALQETFDADPAAFWLRFGAPLLPKGAKLELEITNEPTRALYLAVCAAVNGDPAPLDRELGEPVLSRMQEPPPVAVPGNPVAKGPDGDTAPPGDGKQVF